MCLVPVCAIYRNLRRQGEYISIIQLYLLYNSQSLLVANSPLTAFYIILQQLMLYFFYLKTVP